jgi:hypothetical protein
VFVFQGFKVAVTQNLEEVGRTHGDKPFGAVFAVSYDGQFVGSCVWRRLLPHDLIHVQGLDAFHLKVKDV